MNYNLQPPFLLFVGCANAPHEAKSAYGVYYWRKEDCVGQVTQQLFDFIPKGISKDLPILSIEEGVRRGAKTLIMGVATIGGQMHPTWYNIVEEAIKNGLHVASGMHSKLNDREDLVKLATKYNVNLIDVRKPTINLPIGNGIRRSGCRILTVGTDSSVGKMFTTLALYKEMKKRNVNCTFRATGQTGIFISGSGICVDAVVSDFVSGAAELLTPNNSNDHWDIIEGQGSLYHPSYAGVSLGLLHGSQPDAFVMCHEPTRNNMRGVPSRIPSIIECIDLTTKCAQIVNPKAYCAGVSINTSRLKNCEDVYLSRLEDSVGLPCVNPLKNINKIVDNILR